MSETGEHKDIDRDVRDQRTKMREITEEGLGKKELEINNGEESKASRNFSDE